MMNKEKLSRRRRAFLRSRANATLLFLTALTLFCSAAAYLGNGRTVSEETATKDASEFVSITEVESKTRSAGRGAAGDVVRLPLAGANLLMAEAVSEAMERNAGDTAPTEEPEPTVVPVRPSKPETPTNPTPTPLYSDEEIYLAAKTGFCEVDSVDEERLYWCISVIYNRVQSSYFPDNIHDVVYQENQYECTWQSWWEEREPDEKALSIAEDIFTNGTTVPSDCVFQAEFTQGDGTYETMGNTKFCYSLYVREEMEEKEMEEMEEKGQE